MTKWTAVVAVLGLAALLISSPVIRTQSMIVDNDCIVMPVLPDPPSLTPHSYAECVRRGGRIGHRERMARRICVFSTAGGPAYQECARRGGSITVGDDFINQRAYYSCSLVLDAVYDIECLRRKLASGTTSEKLVSLRIVGELGRDGDPATSDVVNCAWDPDPAVRRAALNSLLNMGDTEISHFRKHLHDPDQDVRSAAWSGVLNIEENRSGQAQKEAVQLLMEALNDQSLDGQRRAAAARIARDGTPAQKAVALPILDEIMNGPCIWPCDNQNEPSENLRWSAAIWLACGGREGNAVLARNLESPRLEVRLLAAYALAIHPDQAPDQCIKVLVEGLGNEEEWSHLSYVGLDDLLDSTRVNRMIRDHRRTFLPLLEKAEQARKGDYRDDKRVYVRRLLRVARDSVPR